MTETRPAQGVPPPAFYRRALEQCPDPIMVTDTNLNWPGPTILFVNEAFERMSGYRRDEIVGHSPRLLQGPQTDPEVLRHLRQQLEAGEDFVGETANYRRDGEEYRVEWKITGLRDDAGRVTHYLSVQRDVTRLWQERQLAQGYQREQKRRMRLLTLLHRAALLAHDAGASRREEVLQHFAVLLPTSLREPARAAARIAYNGRHYTSPGFQPLPPLHREALYTTLSGPGVVELTPRPGWADTGGGPDAEEVSILNAVLEVLRVYLIRVEMDQAHQKGKRLMTLLHRLSTDQEIAKADKCRILLEDSLRAFNADVALVAHRKDDALRVLRAVPEPGPLPGEVLDVTALLPAECGAIDDLRVGISCTWYEAPRHWLTGTGHVGPPLHAGLQAPVVVQGRCAGYLGFFCTSENCAGWTPMDAESLQLLAQWLGGQWNEELHQRHLQRQRDTLNHIDRVGLLGELATGLAHELNQPLAAIVNYADAVTDRVAGEGPVEKAELLRLLDKLGAQAERASQVVERARAFARREPGRIPERRLQPRQLIEDVRDLIDLELRRGQASLKFVMPDALPDLRVDPLQIQQVLLNLVRNGVEAMHTHPDAEDRRLWLTVEECDGHVRFSVCNTGPGMSERVREGLFEPFFTTKPKGMGLGLPISYSIIEAHGGRLWFEETENVTCFCFHLPIPRSTGYTKGGSGNKG